MKKYILFVSCTLFTIAPVLAQVSLEYYLPPNTTFNPEIPTPKSVIGHEVGEWHISHDKLVQYAYALAQISDRVEIEEYARSHENRPLINLTISSPKNMKGLEKIRTEHLKLSDYTASAGLSLTNMPAVVYLGYSVHGNEPSGSNAALLVMYYLAAAEGQEIENWLTNTVVLLDPSYNPDGLNRFASWVNTRRSQNLVSDPNNMEQNEPWPRARTNHYWFDLNRDWLPVQHPESQGRIRQFHRWKPNILTDHHEMGTNGTFFFQPGIPSRNNPLTPKNNYVLTEKIGQYHASALDEIGSLYYSKESFDDFYVGKGSTYPDINGCIGILFEQASSRGHAQKSANGILTFPFTIRNHFTTSLSTLRAANEMKMELLTHQKQFYESIPAEADKRATKAYVFSAKGDHSRGNAFLDILDIHQIEVYALAKDHKGFSKSESYVVPLKQQGYSMIQSMFETRTQFQDSLFYDVSTWTLPLAFDLDYMEIKGKEFSSSLIGKQIHASSLADESIPLKTSSYAYAFHWGDMHAPALLFSIQKLGLRTKVGTEPWRSSTGELFEKGSILIPVQNQDLSRDQMGMNLLKLSNRYGIPITSLETGNSLEIQLGSPKLKNLKKPEPLLLIGKGTNPYEAGEVWHLLDQRIGMALPMITQDKLNAIDLSNYNVLIMVSGNYSSLAQAKIKSWVQNGGRIIAIKSAGKWASDAGLSKMKYKKIEKDSTRKFLTYNQRTKTNGAQEIGGAIFSSQLDLTHPLCFGYSDETLPLFKRGKLFMEPSKNPYAQPVRYAQTPLLSGYISEENLQHVSGSPAIGITAFGKGMVISMTDNPNFRGYWYGPSRLFLNAIFFSDIIASGSAR